MKRNNGTDLDHPAPHSVNAPITGALKVKSVSDLTALWTVDTKNQKQAYGTT